MHFWKFFLFEAGGILIPILAAYWVLTQWRKQKRNDGVSRNTGLFKWTADEIPNSITMAPKKEFVFDERTVGVEIGKMPVVREWRQMSSRINQIEIEYSQTLIDIEPMMYHFLSFLRFRGTLQWWHLFCRTARNSSKSKSCSQQIIILLFFFKSQSICAPKNEIW